MLRRADHRVLRVGGSNSQRVDRPEWRRHGSRRNRSILRGPSRKEHRFVLGVVALSSAASAGARVRAAPAEQIADAVLYEGYVLYPYRASAAKNRLRWQVGLVMPRAYADAT